MNSKFAQQLGSEETYPHLLEKNYPHIVEKMALHWEAATFEDYLASLLFDQRGHRAGFPPGILQEIFSLQNHYRSRQAPRPISIDTWADSVALPRRHHGE
ncbi:MAG: hypothetical protein HYZ65_02200 [Burkholderiales bacterium]|nr:hypothetical protein [Burkholderiales bacterium]